MSAANPATKHSKSSSKPHYDATNNRLPKSVERYIQLYREAPQDSDYLFTGYGGGKLTTNEGLNSRLKDIAEKAGIQEIIGKSPLTKNQQETMNTDQEYREWHRVIVHVLRHTGLTLMVDAGVPEEVAKYIANHDHMETLKTYIDEEHIVDHDTFRNEYTPPSL